MLVDQFIQVTFMQNTALIRGFPLHPVLALLVLGDLVVRVASVGRTRIDGVQVVLEVGVVGLLRLITTLSRFINI